MLEGDSNVLGDLYKNCKDAREKIRYEALYAVSRGRDVKTVADIVAWRNPRFTIGFTDEMGKGASRTTAPCIMTGMSTDSSVRRRI